MTGEPKLCIVAFTSDSFHPYRLADSMKAEYFINSASAITDLMLIILFRPLMAVSLGEGLDAVLRAATDRSAPVPGAPGNRHLYTCTSCTSTFPHLAPVAQHTEPGLVDALLADLRAATLALASQPDQLTGRAAVYGMAQQIPQSLVQELAAGFMDILYSTNTE